MWEAKFTGRGIFPSMRRLLVTALLFLAACKAPEGPATATATATAPAKAATHALPSAAEAQSLIAGSPEFGEYQFTSAATTIPLKVAGMRADQKSVADALRAAGWIRYSGDDVVLAKGKDDPRFLVRPNGFLDVVPLAKKELLSVDALRALPDGNVAAGVTWHWVANDAGASFKSGELHDRFATTNKAKVTLLWDGTAWSVLRIEP